ncbi:MAG: putative HAD superfamily phosphohydrolase YqeG, partial [Gammaproteobacteria bacterium]
MVTSDTETMRHITTVILDLDDTLWDLPLVISHAEQSIYAWFSEHYPRINERFSIADLRRLR